MLAEGTIINGRYKVTKVIGKGGTSIVYLVIDIHIGKIWAMKEIIKRSDLSYTLAEREIETLKSINYFMFPRILDAWQDHYALYIVSDYVEGIPLSKVIAKRRITKDKCIQWGLSILNGLEYLHNLSPPILYLDLKPDNIIICSDGTLRMIDFGIASTVEGRTLTMGTCGYAPPEQYSDLAVDVRADIYAFGATYYALRTGKNPDKEPCKVISLIEKSKLITNKEKNILIKCLAESPDDRFYSATHVKQSLNQIKANRFKSKKVFTFIEIISLLLIFGMVIFMKLDEDKRKHQAAEDMIVSANSYLENDEYTSQGIKVITTFINSGCLSKEAEEEFTFEVAKNYFEVQQNYSESLKYFKKLDEKKYPEVHYYIELCQLEMSFECDEDKALKCVKDFYRDVNKEKSSIKKYENLLFISKCFEKYEKDKGEGIKKSITVLEGAQIDLKREYENEEYEEYKKIYEKYNNRLETLYLKAKRAKI